ncbi:hypothetical protein H4R34_002488 [Dimargaris verticillata]|uniref:Uncharacterized protein n=1 Tax=Dimargaris verticillata TaxID=2761393 RepID=A0A9W8B9C8_9FUNG|nr:hypothetical protein H4R34_002488 [Dimargaris verticillata]
MVTVTATMQGLARREERIRPFHSMAQEYVMDMAPLHRLKLRRFFEHISFKLQKQPESLPPVPAHRTSTLPTVIRAVASPITPKSTAPKTLLSKGGTVRFAAHLRFEEYQYTRHLHGRLKKLYRQTTDATGTTKPRIGLKNDKQLNSAAKDALSHESPEAQRIEAAYTAMSHLHGRGHVSADEAQALLAVAEAFLVVLGD